MVSSTSGMGCKLCVVVGPRASSGHWLQVTVSTALPKVRSSTRFGSGVKWVSTPRPAERPVGATVVRERKTPEQARSEASTRVSRLQAALSSLGDGDAAEKRALEVALVKAQKQAEEMPVARQIEVTKEFIMRAKKRMLVADEKIRLAQVALQDAMDEKEYDLREVPLAEARLERLQKEVVPPRQTPPASVVSDLEGEVQRLRTQLAQVQAAQTPKVGRHPPQSSVQAADMLRERAAKTACGSFRAHPNRPARPRVLLVGKAFRVARCGPIWGSRVHPLFDGPIHQGAAQLRMPPSMVTNVVSA